MLRSGQVTSKFTLASSGLRMNPCDQPSQRLSIMSIFNPSWSFATNFLRKNPRFRKRHRQNPWLALGVLALGFMMVSTNVKADEKFQVDWSLFDASSPPQKSDPSSRIAFLVPLSPDSMFVGPGTEPPNPFPGLESSLYVKATKPEDGWFRFVGRLFVGESAAQGVFEFDFRLVEESISLSLGNCSEPWTPDNLSTYYITEGQGMVGVAFVPGEGVQIRGRSYQTGSVATLAAGENYRFLIKWDTATPEGFTCFLNGEPLTPVTGSGAQGFSAKSAEFGINVFRITTGGIDRRGTFFLGRILARSGPVDLLSPEGLTEK